MILWYIRRYALPPKPAPGSTERAYVTDWQDFNAFAARIRRGGQRPAEPETVAFYVVDLARRDRAAATIARRLTAITVYRAASY